MKPLYKIGLFFVGAVLVILLCYAVVKQSFLNHDTNMAEEKTPSSELTKINSPASPLDNNREVNGSEPLVQLPGNTPDLQGDSETTEGQKSNSETEDMSKATETMTEYYLTCVDGYVTVLYPDHNTIFFETGIYIEELPYVIRQAIIEGKTMKSVEEIYNFLESYTS